MGISGWRWEVGESHFAYLFFFLTVFSRTRWFFFSKNITGPGVRSIFDSVNRSPFHLNNNYRQALGTVRVLDSEQPLVLIRIFFFFIPSENTFSEGSSTICRKNKKTTPNLPESVFWKIRIMRVVYDQRRPRIIPKLYKRVAPARPCIN